MSEYNIHHFGIRVSDIKNSIKWYENNFGFKKIRESNKPDLSIKLAHLKLNKFFIELIQPYEIQKQNSEQTIKTLSDALTNSPSHLAIIVNDLSSVYSKFKKTNIKIIPETTETSFFCYDPDKNLIEIKQKK